MRSPSSFCVRVYLTRPLTSVKSDARMYCISVSPSLVESRPSRAMAHAPCAIDIAASYANVLLFIVLVLGSRRYVMPVGQYLYW